MASPKFRIDSDVHQLLVHSTPQHPKLVSLGTNLPEPVFPQYPEKLHDPGPETPPEQRNWTASLIWRTVRGWLIPYVRSRVLPGELHPITAYFFLDYKCNLDCWYCPSFDNRVKGMTEDTARRGIDWLYDTGCRVLALMGGEPLLRPDFAHKIVYYAAKKGFWVYIGTNGQLLRPEVADRLGDAGVAVYNFALDAWDRKPGLPKALMPVRRNLEYLMRKQYVYGYMVFFNMNICANNGEDIRRLTEYAREHRVATDYHINETPMLDQSDHFKHYDDNPTWIRAEDWRDVDELIDWIVAKNRQGYQMVNSIPRLQEMKAFVRMASHLNLTNYGWHGDGTGAEDLQERLKNTPGVITDGHGNFEFAPWNCRAGHNNVIVRTDGTVGPCFPMYPATYDWGTIAMPKFDTAQLCDMKNTCQKHCFSTLNHNLAYCYNDARVINYLWDNVKRGLRGGVSSFHD